MDCGQLKEMAVFNRELALGNVGGDEELLQEIVGLYLREYPALLAQIQSAVKAGDAQSLYHSAHTLKGSLGALGAESPQQQAGLLEMSGRTAQMDEAGTMLKDLESLLGQLDRELER